MISIGIRDTVVVEGFVKHDPKLARRGVVVFLSPWWHGPAHFLDAPLRVRIPSSEHASDAQLARGTSVRITCTNLEPPRAGACWWAATGSGELQAPPCSTPPASTEYVPVIMLDRFFGRLVLEPRSSAFRGQRSARGRTYQVLIGRSAPADDRSADHLIIDRARAVFRLLELDLGRIHQEVASHALTIYVSRWRGARAALSRDEVAARIALSSVRLGFDGSLALCFAEGDLFYGHWIEVRLDPDLRVQSAEVAGLQKVS